MRKLIPSAYTVQIIGVAAAVILIFWGLTVGIEKHNARKNATAKQLEKAKLPCSIEYLRIQRQMERLVDNAVIAADNHNEALADSLDKQWQADSVKLSKLGPCTIYTSKIASR